jgi:6-phosphogluconolactonase
MLSPDEKYLLFTDLGTDKVNIYRYKPSNAQPLSYASSVSVKPGNGPRHLEFAPNKKQVYLLQEMGSTITAYDYNGGKLKEIQSVSILAENFKGAVGAAAIHISPDGNFLYASNRGDANEIVVYAINPLNGQLTFVERHSTYGQAPRDFAIDPTGHFLVVANQGSDSIYVFKIDTAKGTLAATVIKIEVGNPVCLKFTPAE